ncbi:MAG: hypothetical protein ABI451_03680 [Dokdonella sp.]
MSPSNRRRSVMLVAIIGYVIVVVTAIVVGNAALSAFSTLILLTIVLTPSLVDRRVWAWIAWATIIAAVLVLTLSGHGKLAFDAVPILINLALAIFFGRTLFDQREPMIARAIVALEGEQRLALPGVASYARHLTLAWTLLFAVQACLLSIVFCCRTAEGVFAALGWPTPLSLPTESANAYLRFGGYLVTLAFFVVEYPIRRWRLRHLPHAPAHNFAGNLATNWHRILHDRKLPADGAP